MERIKLLLTLDIDPETGDTTCVNREIINDDIKKVTKKKKATVKEDEDTTPKIILEDNKYKINQAVVKLLELDLDEENRLEINYEKSGKTVTPLFGTNYAFGHSDSKGNKLTKSLTVACRGNANSELAEFGNEFTLEPHPTKENIYILKGTNEVTIPDGDENVAVPQEITDDTLDLSDFIAEESEEEHEVDGFDFNLN